MRIERHLLLAVLCACVTAMASCATAPRTSGPADQHTSDARIGPIRIEIGGDVTIGYEKGVPSLWQYVKGYAKTAHLHVRRFAVADLPESDAELTEWLLERFREKDQLLEDFYQQGKFPGKRQN